MTASNHAFLLMLHISVSAAGVAAAVCFLQLIAGRRLRPVWRQRLWGLVALRLLLPVLPASPTSVENWWPSVLHVTAPATNGNSSVVDSPGGAGLIDLPKVAVTYGPVEAASKTVPSRFEPAASRKSFAASVVVIASAVWLGGVLLGLSRLLIVNAIFARRLRRAKELPDAAALLQASGVAPRGRPLPRVLVTDAVTVPAAAGVFRPVILFPPALLESLDRHEQRAVLLHELAHVRHRDVTVNWALAILQTIHWFNPVVRLAFARLRADREIVRDGEVLRAMAGPNPRVTADHYARVLLRLTELLSGARVLVRPVAAAGIVGRGSGCVVGLFSDRNALERRITAIASFTGRNGGRSIVGPVLVLAVAGCTLTRGRSPTQADGSKTVAIPATRPAQTKASDEDVDEMIAWVWDLTGQKKYAEALALDERMLARFPGNRFASDIHDLLQDKSLARVHHFQATARSDESVNAQLNRVIPRMDFDAGALSEVLDLIRVSSGVNLFVDWKSLEARGVDRNTPVTCRLHALTFGRALQMILDSVGGAAVRLDYRIEDGVVMVSTAGDLVGDLIVRVYDVRDLLVSVPDFEPPPPTNGGPREGRPTTAPAAPPVPRLVDRLVNLIEDTVAPETWKNRFGQIGDVRELQGQLIITQTPENHVQIVTLLQQLRQTRGIQVIVEARFISCDPSLAETLISRWQLKPTTEPAPATQPAGSLTAFLNDRQVLEFLKEATNSPAGTLLTAPRITLFNGQRAYVQVTTQKAYVDDYVLVKTAAGETRYDPARTVVQTGVVMDVQATAAADRRAVTLTLRPKLSALLGMKRVPWPSRPPGSNLTVDEPQIRSSELQTTVNVADHDTLLLGGLEDPGVGREGPALHDGKRRALFLLVKPAIITQTEVNPNPDRREVKRPGT